MKLTDNQIANILDDMVIITDTREQKNQHILDWLDNNCISHKTEKVDTGDYTFILPNYLELNVDRKFIVERKGSLNELAGNFTTGRARFTREFERITDEHIHIVIENATWKKILKGSYRGNFNPKSYMASLLTTGIRYKCQIWFCSTDESPEIIYNILKYELREFLKNKC